METFLWAIIIFWAGYSYGRGYKFERKKAILAAVIGVIVAAVAVALKRYL